MANKPTGIASPKPFSQPGDGARSTSQPKAPGGKGWLRDPSAFTDARPPAAKGAKKSAGYPNYPRKK